ncbi:MAG: DUF364 domain-containing protein [Myxococcales bacterium]|nr:DUF364 domain-containing protein [Myxococcales bacterium]
MRTNPVEKIIDTLRGDHPVTDVRICQRSVMVKSKRLGLAYLFPRDASSNEKRNQIRGCGSLTKLGAKELSAYALSDDLTEASVGVAAINSLIDIEEKKVQVRNGKKSLYERCAGKRVAMVGRFKFAEELKKLCAHLDILELHPSPGDLPAGAADDVIPLAEVVIITGTTLINGTFTHIADLTKNAFVSMLGPSSVISPVLFEYGIDEICGSRVIDDEMVIRFVSEGGSFGDLSGVEQIVLSREDNN